MQREKYRSVLTQVVKVLLQTTREIVKGKLFCAANNNKKGQIFRIFCASNLQ